MKIAIFYHDDEDGFTAAWAVYRLKPDCKIEAIPVNYGDELPSKLPPADCLYIVDFSFPAEQLAILCDKYPEVVLIDHHRTALERLADFEHPHYTGYIDMKYSGAVLTWIVLDPTDVCPIPGICRYVEDRDLWKFELPDSDAVNLWLSCIPHTFEHWNEAAEMISEHLDHVIRQGWLLNSYRKTLVRAVVEKAMLHIATVDGVTYRVGQVNSPILQSEIAHEILDTMEVDVADVWSTEGTKTTHSLRSRKGEVDVSEIAKKFGGGGHPSAAGFRTAASGASWHSCFPTKARPPKECKCERGDAT